MCSAINNCTHFSLKNESCRLHNGEISKSDAIFLGDSSNLNLTNSLTCGIPFQNPQKSIVYLNNKTDN